MAKILQLEPHIADLIAAGEVVERPASVIKELMENSIDAGAVVITVEIKNGGMNYMRLTDNGCGIALDDAATAFLRHATSKLWDEKGLESISTLGFRGEALAAIAAVSRIELLTKETGAVEGVSLSIEGGVVRDRSTAGCPEGTTIVVRDLFFNTPARLKFMKTDRAEGAAVSAMVISCALSHPEVSVRYIKDGKEECHTPGDGRIDSCIYSLFGRDFAGGMLKAATEDGRVSVTGYISSPTNARGNRSYQFFFVNGRYVKSKTLQAALEQAYKNTLFTGRFPTCVLYVSLSPSDVDVNVHPTKTQVKFVKERQVFDGVYYASRSALDQAMDRPTLELTDATKSLPMEGSGSNIPEQVRPVGRQSAADMIQENSVDKPRRSETNGNFSNRLSTMSEQSFFAPVRDDRRTPYRSTVSDARDARAAADYYPTQSVGLTPEKPVRVVGEALGTYILAEQGESLWLIDKHAAHERIHFDRLKSEKQVIMSQTLIQPIICDLGKEETVLLLEKAELFGSLGFLVEPFGEALAAVRQIPADLESGDVEKTLGEMMHLIRRGGQPDDGTLRDELLQTIACKAAIKAGRRSEQLEIETLVEMVLSGAVRYCPHGRPVAVELTKTALDRSFKRT